MNSNETVIVIRSLVPGGVAQTDGRLIPGDRLLSVNSVNLEHASLDQAVQALKGAPRGVVTIAVAKPLPIPDSVSQVSEPLSPAARWPLISSSPAAAAHTVTPAHVKLLNSCIESSKTPVSKEDQQPRHFYSDVAQDPAGLALVKSESF